MESDHPIQKKFLRKDPHNEGRRTFLKSERVGWGYVFLHSLVLFFFEKKKVSTIVAQVAKIKDSKNVRVYLVERDYLRLNKN